MGDNLRLSDHSQERIRKRLGLGKGSVQKNAERAFELGIKHSETTGQLNKYITKMFFKGVNQGKVADNIRIYNHYIYLFSGVTLITVMPIPRNLIKAEESLKKRRTINNSNHMSSAIKETEFGN